ncbi:MAG TPA: AMP-binding protein [Candidatus Sulfotelmatobacter sp.]|nr:AMP-binding protein [Candidatus Sulfotelmatobacter sp.]
MRLIDFFDRGAARHAGRACLIDGEASYSYAEVQAMSCHIGNGLIAAGIAPGDKVAVYSPNAAKAFVAVLGVLRAGATWVAINARNSLADNIAFLELNDCRCLFFHSSFEAAMDEIKAAVPSITRCIAIDRASPHGPDLFDWMAAFDSSDPDIAVPSDAAVLHMGTGGTTGRSKGVVLTHRNLATMIANFGMAMPYAEPPVHLVAAPMTHAAGLISFPLMAMGASNVVIGSADPLNVMTHIEKHRVTTLFLPPTVIYMILAHPRARDFDYRSLKHLVYAAAPMSVDKLKQAIALFGPVLIQTFGQAEAPMICTYMTPAEHLVLGDPEKEKRLASCGRAALFTPLAIMADDGRLLPAGERGEIVVRGDLVMRGYYKNPQATAEVSAHGWHHTGDIGVMDADGYVYIVDRKRDMIISGGFNVYPSEVERVLWAHPAVQDCAVIGVPDDKWGEAVKAVIELKPGAVLDEAALIAHCKGALGSVKAPKSIEAWDKLPRSPVGKVLKRDIRERYWSGRERKI